MPTSQPVRVFLSSTIYDFRDLRSALRFWFEELGYEVLMSEVSDFERRPDSSTFDACFEAIHYCDFYILLVGERYGSIFQDGISVTNQEFRVAKALADEKRIAMIPFVRKSVWQEAELAAAAGGASTIRTADAQSAEQMARVLAFVNELKSTKLLDDAGKEAGNLWIYTFDAFADIVAALRIALRANTDIGAQRLLANLKDEIESNIAGVVSKHEGLPFSFYAPLQLPEVRAALRVTVQDQGTTRRIDAGIGRSLVLGLLMAEKFMRLKVEALEETIHSGEFLHFDPQACTFSETAELRVMRQLSEQIGRLREMAEIGARPPFSELSERILGEVQSGAQEVDILAEYLLLSSMVLHACETMMRQMVALHRWIETGTIGLPEAEGESFEVESLRRLRHTLALNEDVTRWLEYPAVVDLLTGAQTATGDEVRVATEAFPVLGSSYQATVHQFLDDLMQVYILNSRAVGNP